MAQDRGALGALLANRHGEAAARACRCSGEAGPEARAGEAPGHGAEPDARLGPELVTGSRDPRLQPGGSTGSSRKRMWSTGQASYT